jgi:hypothetical protein
VAAADRPDPPPRRPPLHLRLGLQLPKLTGSAITPADLGPTDPVLLSHDHHGDNLDTAGRALLLAAGVVLTTAAGAHRLGGNARGLQPRATTQLEAPAKPPIQVTATPCRHGPPLSRPIVGEVIGFALGWEGQAHGNCGSPATPCSTTASARSPTAFGRKPGVKSPHLHPHLMTSGNAGHLQIRGRSGWPQNAWKSTHFA